MNGINRMKHALLSQSAPGKHRARESAPTGKEVSDDRRPPHPENPAHLGHPASDNRKRGQAHQPVHNCRWRACKARLPGIYWCAVGNRAYPVHRDQEVSSTGNTAFRLSERARTTKGTVGNQTCGNQWRRSALNKEGLNQHR